ncbi:FYN-binding protein 1 isoform X1 [Electrophorus electricus]|uniref:SH3 domain-containing protein n=1 Tax=Electrophorus electricus TaxID=8005 RepID=A0A4W4FUY8_ELEEL|nr:FYN-binding protein 1 isoform X1 [Electrophorus electricus]
MDNKSDVKAIMARFQSGGTSMEGGGGGHPKAAVHPTLSGPTVPFKKPVLETTLSGSAAATNPTATKYNYPMSTSSIKNSSESRESMKPKALVSRFENAGLNEDSKTPPFAKTLKPKLSDPSQDSEQKLLFPKALAQKTPVSSTTPDIKNTPDIKFSKPPPVTNKPLLTPKIENNENSTSPKMPTIPKPKSNLVLLRQQTDDAKDGDSAVKPFSGSGVKPSSFRAAQNIFSKGEEATKDAAKLPSSKDSPGPGPGPIIAKKPSYRRKASGSNTETANNDPSAPKRKPLPNILAIGSAPSKPNRPPRVNLEKFKKGVELPSEGAELKKGGPPPPPASHPSSQAAQDARPTLPPRPSGAIKIQEDQDDSYDDIGDLKDSSFGGNSEHQDEGSGSDEMYEDLEDRWSAAEAKEQEKKREKEEKRRAEQEKKDQKDRERKEQEARKKFKLSGPLQVIHKVKVRLDCKGGKNDLSIKQGESIEILRVTENPEGRWLARTQDGSYGYVKTESVEIDFDKLKTQSLSRPPQSEEVYDDVAPQDELKRRISGAGVILPPPPEGDGDIYDDLDEPSLIVSSPERRLPAKPRSFFRMLKAPIDWRKPSDHDIEVPPPPQFSPEGNADQSSAPISDEIYDDVDPFPALPPPSSLPQIKAKSAKGDKVDDPKKQKKFEKEEKDFRKKFKFEGEIKVLYQVTVKSGKKGSGKDLSVQAGEVLDVINKADHDKLICRNKEGKFGYVSTSNTQSEDNDIYDDIGDDCIYDND